MSVSLQQLVSQERERLGLSLRQVADRSDGRLSSSTVHAIEQGRRATVNDETVEGLARALSLPLPKVAASAGLPTSDSTEPFVLPRRANRLTRRERDHVLALVDLLLDRRTR